MNITDQHLSLGIDFGGTTLKIGVCHHEKIVYTHPPIPTKQFRSADGLIESVLQTLIEIRHQYPSISSIGVGVPGLVNHESGLVRQLTNVPGWVDVNLRSILQEKTELPTAVDNDANCAAYAEWRFGAGRGATNMIAMTLGTGVGGGIILNKTLYRGSQFAAGELGQISIDYRGESGEYHNRGAIEKYCGNHQIAQHAQKLYEAANIEKSVDDCTPKALALAAEQGDSIAGRVWREIAEKLATLLSSVIWLLNPDTIIIGGGVAKAGSLLFTPLRDHLKSQLHHIFWENLTISPAQFDNNAGIIGSATMAADQAAHLAPKN